MAGKSLDELNLTDRPLPTPDTRPTTDPRGSGWYHFVTDIEDLISGGTVNFAETTLRDIQQTVERTQRVTEGQRRAVDNIEAAGQRSRSRFGSRRYEGYR